MYHICICLSASENQMFWGSLQEAYGINLNLICFNIKILIIITVLLTDEREHHSDLDEGETNSDLDEGETNSDFDEGETNSDFDEGETHSDFDEEETQAGMR